jgi:tight adherence protein C
MLGEFLDFLARDPWTIGLALIVSTLTGLVLVGWQWLSARRDVARRRNDVVRMASAGDEKSEQSVTPPMPGGPPARAAASKPAIFAEAMTRAVDRLFAQGEDAQAKVLKRRLVQGGYYSNSAVAWFFAARMIGLVVGVLASLIAGVFALDMQLSSLYMIVVVGAAVGYFGPNIVLSQRISQRRTEHLSGFPDFLDLMVVCAEAGLSMEASLNRVCREMAISYPSLSANLYFATLEVRAGRTMNDALQSLAERLGIGEAKTFATLLQQSAELGSSLTDSLKIYSEEMREKRMSKAEEKAHALPAKLVVPLMLFIVPILFVVLLYPAIARVMQAWPDM